MSSFYTRPVTQLPGGLPFTDPREPRKKFAGMEVSSEDQQIGRIVKWRSENRALYPEDKYLDWEYVRGELRKYQTDRLGNSKQYFTNGTSVSYGMEIVPRTPSRACECGSMEATNEYCKSCSGARLIGFKCSACGKVRGL